MIRGLFLCSQISRSQGSNAASEATRAQLEDRQGDALEVYDRISPMLEGSRSSRTLDRRSHSCTKHSLNEGRASTDIMASEVLIMALNKAYFCLFNSSEPFGQIPSIRRDIKATKASLERELVRDPGIDRPTDQFLWMSEADLLKFIDEKYEQSDFKTDRDLHAAYIFMIREENNGEGVSDALGAIFGHMSMFLKVSDALSSCDIILEALDTIEEYDGDPYHCYEAIHAVAEQFKPLYEFMNRYFP